MCSSVSLVYCLKFVLVQTVTNTPSAQCCRSKGQILVTFITPPSQLASFMISNLDTFCSIRSSTCLLCSVLFHHDLPFYRKAELVFLPVLQIHQYPWHFQKIALAKDIGKLDHFLRESLKSSSDSGHCTVVIFYAAFLRSTLLLHSMWGVQGGGIGTLTHQQITNS